MAKILAIDDKMDNLVTLSALLKNLMPGCAVITARSGIEGIEAAGIELPDTILLDVKMPDMDGFETCRRLKSDQRTKHIPVIMITAIRTDPRSRIKGLEIGADAFLAKPIDPYELVSQVNVALRIKKAEDALREERDALESLVEERTEALKKSEAKYRSMMETMDDPVYICSKDFRVEYMNTAMIKRHGHDATGELCHRAIYGLDAKCPWCVHEKVMGGETIRIETVTPKDNKTFHVSNSPICNTPGSISILTIFRDITEIKKMEETLRQSQKIESIGTLAGGIAHDFNNILSPLLGFAELLKEDLPVDSPLQDHIDEILRATFRSKDLVKRILAFSRKGEQNIKPIRLHPIINEALKLLRSSIPTTIDIHEEIDSKCGIVLADAIQIHQIVMNLATNAYHAMEEKGGRLDVSLKQVEVTSESAAPDFLKPKPGKYALLTMSDTGIGIEKNILKKIFDPYFTTKAIGKGTGLGLSMVHGIVKAHEGEILIDSRPGKGSTIHVYLPIMEKAAEDGRMEDVESIPGGTERILLVDDEVAIVRLERQMLERLGYRVTACSGSAEAVEAFKAGPALFDLVVTDMTMPHMTGIGLAEKLISIRPDIPVILCTGYSDKISEEKVKAIGIRGFLMKPMAKSDLARTVREVLDSKKPGDR